MTLSPETIDEWAADPEGYFVSEESRTAEDNVAVSAQILFCSLVESSLARPIVLPRLIGLLSDSESQLNACGQEVSSRGGGSIPSRNVHPSVVLWEAIYTAAGLCASMLDDIDGWDFQVWYHGILSPCLDLLLSSNASVSSSVSFLVCCERVKTDDATVA